MIDMIKLTPIVLSVLLLVGCSSGTELDISSKEAFEKTSEQMYNELDSDEKKAEFKQALGYLFMKALNADFRGAIGKDDGSKAELESYNGMTADEIISKVKKEVESNK